MHYNYDTVDAGNSISRIQCQTIVYTVAQRQLDTCTRSAGSAPKGDIGTTRYIHAGAYWDFSC